MKIEDKTVSSILPTPFQCTTQSISWNNKTKKETRVFQIEKDEVKLPLFTDDLLLYIRDPRIPQENTENQ